MNRQEYLNEIKDAIPSVMAAAHWLVKFGKYDVCIPKTPSDGADNGDIHLYIDGQEGTKKVVEVKGHPTIEWSTLDGYPFILIDRVGILDHKRERGIVPDMYVITAKCLRRALTFKVREDTEFTVMKIRDRMTEELMDCYMIPRAQCTAITL